MYKYILGVIGAFFVSGALLAPQVYAADVALAIADQSHDILAIAQVSAVKATEVKMRVTHYFPQSRISNLEEITVRGTGRRYTKGQSYFMSLDKKDTYFVPKVGVYQVTSNDWQSARVVPDNQVSTSTAAGVQSFISSNGKPAAVAPKPAPAPKVVAPSPAATSSPIQYMPPVHATSSAPLVTSSSPAGTIQYGPASDDISQIPGAAMKNILRYIPFVLVLGILLSFLYTLWRGE